ncbi:MAG: hypothetical protein RLZZ272_227 [Actinomycetota bacterium]|jgi:hypothetical protein
MDGSAARRAHRARRSARGRVAPTSALLATLAILTVGCGAIAEQATEQVIERAIESETGGSVDIDTDGDGSVTIETEDGTASFGTGEVPAAIASEFDLPGGLEVLTTSEVSADGATTSYLIATTDDDPQGILDDLQESAESGGWSIDSTFTIDATAGFSASRGDAEVAQVTVSADGSTTTVSITLQLMG